MGLTRSELYFLELEYKKKKKIYCLYRSRTNYIRFNNLNIKKTDGGKLSHFVICIEGICCGSLTNFPVVAVFINCSNSKQYHYRSHAWYNLTSNKILVTYTVVLKNTKWLPHGKGNARMYNIFISQEKDKEQ